ncbi:Uncharacterised protein [Salmonella enterica]|nr:Uncharacterised protein [Salmonella enterica]
MLFIDIIHFMLLNVPCYGFFVDLLTGFCLFIWFFILLNYLFL